MLSARPELFDRNTDFAEVLQPRVWGAWRAPYLRAKRLDLSYTSPINEHSHQVQDRSPDEHILKILCRKAGLAGAIELRPYLHLSDAECSRWRLGALQLAVQAQGESSGAAMKNKLWPTDRMAAVVRSVQHSIPEVSIIQLGDKSDPLLPGVIDMRGKTSLRETAAILSQSKAYVGTVGLLMHMARAVGCRSVIIYGGREKPWQTGYQCNVNLATSTDCSPCWKWNTCEFDRKCLAEITVEMVLEKVLAVLAAPQVPLEEEWVKL